MRIVTLLLVVSLAASEVGSQTIAFKLPLILRNTSSVDDMIREAPIIVIGKVVSEHWTGPLMNQHWQRMEVKVAVENVIRGDVNDDSILTFYFNFYAFATIRSNANWLYVDGRYVLFLMKDRGVLRAVEDERQTNIGVPSGRHRDLPLSSERPLAERIGVLLLTPGEDINPPSFSNGLLHAEPYTRQHLGRWRTAKMLRVLLASPYRAVRVGACEELSLGFVNQDSCWNTIDVGDGSDFRWHYGIIPPISSRWIHRRHLMRTKDPQRWLESPPWVPPGTDAKAALLDEFRLFTTDNDRRIRKRFCEFLSEKFPGEMDSGCGQAGR